MTPSPATGDLAACHRVNRTAHPDRRVDMNYPHADDNDRRQRMNENGDPLDLDACIGTKILVPAYKSARNQGYDQDRHQPEDSLLSSIVFADLRHSLFMSAEHVAELGKPSPILDPPQIGPPEANKKTEEAEKQNDPYPRVYPARDLAPTEEA